MMDKLLVSLGLKYAAAKLDGKKTYFGGAVLMLLGAGKIITGLVGIVGNMYPDIAPPVDIETCTTAIQTGAGMFGAGLAAIGIGHKVEKNA